MIYLSVALCFSIQLFNLSSSDVMEACNEQTKKTTTKTPQPTHPSLFSHSENPHIEHAMLWTQSKIDLLKNQLF